MYIYIYMFCFGNKNFALEKFPAVRENTAKARGGAVRVVACLLAQIPRYHGRG